MNFLVSTDQRPHKHIASYISFLNDDRKRYEVSTSVILLYNYVVLKFVQGIYPVNGT